MSLGRTFTLNTGAIIPAVGLGTWQSKPNEVKNAVEVALKAGYRHIDAALIYGNENEVGQGIKNSGIDRSKIFITTKLWNTEHKAEDVPKSLNESLKSLGLDYVDLYLIHWPFSFKKGGSNNEIDNTIDIKDTWKALEKLVEEGKTKAIGLSNFNIPRIQEILSIAKIQPSVLQVELHPYNPQWELKEFTDKHNIHLTAYSPLGSTNAPLGQEPIIQEIAKKYKKSTAQVLISWASQRGTSVLPKSVTDDRIKSNFEDFEIEKEDFEKINALSRDVSKRHRYCDPKNFWKLECFEDDKQ